MTDEGKITCNGLGVIPSERVRPTPRGWREGPLPAYERCPGCAACPPTAEQLIEARVRAELADEADRRAKTHVIEGCDWYARDALLEFAEDIRAGRIAAGSSPDTTPEAQP